RSDGIASPTASCSIRSRTRSRASLCFVTTCVLIRAILEPSPSSGQYLLSRDDGVGGLPFGRRALTPGEAFTAGGGGEGKTGGVDREHERPADACAGACVDASSDERAPVRQQRRLVVAAPDLGAGRRGVDAEERVRLGAQLLDHLDLNRDPGKVRR